MASIARYVPAILSDVTELNQIYSSEDSELEEVYIACEDYIKEQFLDTMTEYGVGRMEKILGIRPLDSDTLSERKFRLRSWMNSDLPYTLTNLRNMLYALCGDGYTLSISGYELIAKVGLGNKKDFSEVQKLLERVVPANISIDIDLLYNTYEKVSAKTYGALSVYTYEEIRSEPIV